MRFELSPARSSLRAGQCGFARHAPSRARSPRGASRCVHSMVAARRLRQRARAVGPRSRPPPPPNRARRPARPGSARGARPSRRRRPRRGAATRRRSPRVAARARRRARLRPSPPSHPRLPHCPRRPAPRRAARSRVGRFAPPSRTPRSGRAQPAETQGSPNRQIRRPKPRQQWRVACGLVEVDMFAPVVPAARNRITAVGDFLARRPERAPLVGSVL